MRKSRALMGIIAISAMGAATLAASTTASAMPGNNSGGQTVASTGQTFRPSTSPNASRTIINRPNAQYVGHTCKVDLSTIPDYTVISTLDACGITINFSPAVEKRSVPSSWGSWGTPPDTETDSPDILYTSGATSVTVSFSAPVRLSGVEAEPNPFEVHAISADFLRPSGGMKATVTRGIDGTGGARLLAVKTKNVGSIVLSSDVDFAFGQLRINLGAAG